MIGRRERIAARALSGLRFRLEVDRPANPGIEGAHRAGLAEQRRWMVFALLALAPQEG